MAEPVNTLNLLRDIRRLSTQGSEAAEGKTIHVICEVTDNGTPPLTKYRRVVVEIE